MKSQIISKCEYCGIEKPYRYPSLVKRFCSHACANKHKWESRPRGVRVYLKCEFCSKVFSMLASQYKVRTGLGGALKYCSNKCNGLATRKDGTYVTVDCALCGKQFQKRKDHLLESNFCSVKCKNKSRIRPGPWSRHRVDGEKQREYFRNYYKRNSERIRAISRRWAKENRGYRNYIQNIRRAAGSLTLKDYAEITGKGECAFCGDTENLQLDHIIPIAKGGKTELGNVQILCAFCNQSKGTGDKPKTDKKLMYHVHRIELTES